MAVYNYHPKMVYTVLWDGIAHAMVCLSPHQPNYHHANSEIHLTSSRLSSSQLVSNSGRYFHTELAEIMRENDAACTLPDIKRFAEKGGRLASEEFRIFDQFQRIRHKTERTPNCIENSETMEKDVIYFALSSYGRREFWYIATSALRAFAEVGISPARFFGILGTNDPERVNHRPRLLLTLFGDEYLNMSVEEFRAAKSHGSFEIKPRIKKQMTIDSGLNKPNLGRNLPTLEELGFIEFGGKGKKLYMITRDLNPYFSLPGRIKGVHVRSLEQAWHERKINSNKKLTIEGVMEIFGLETNIIANKAGYDGVRRLLNSLVKQGYASQEGEHAYNTLVYPTEKAKRLMNSFFFPLLWHMKDTTRPNEGSFPDPRLTLGEADIIYRNNPHILRRDISVIVKDYLDFMDKKPS